MNAPGALMNIKQDEFKLQGSNSVYAEALLLVATRLGFPSDYLAQIRKEGGLG